MWHKDEQSKSTIKTSGEYIIIEVLHKYFVLLLVFLIYIQIYQQQKQCTEKA